MANLADYEWLTSAAAEPWLALVDESSAALHQLLQKLRKNLTAERARLVIEQMEARTRAKEKFGDWASRMYFSDLALQQSTDRWIARYKASRLPQQAQVVDYCCGIGGDLLGFAQCGTVVGYDRSAEIACLANANIHAVGFAAFASVLVANVEEHPPQRDKLWHVDPDRRVAGRRSTQLHWHSPGVEVVERWLQASPTGVLKLAPATQLPEHWAQSAEVEWITRDRQCRQQVAWCGELAKHPGLRRATIIQTHTPSNELASYSFVGNAHLAADLTDKPAKFLFDTDPAIRAAGLTGAFAEVHGLAALATGAAYLTGDEPVASPLLSCFEVLEVFPLRVKLLAKEMSARRIGQLEIKQRGVDVKPEELRKKLKLDGDTRATLLLTRLQRREIAILAQRQDPERTG